jgi:hypothetical protein
MLKRDLPAGTRVKRTGENFDWVKTGEIYILSQPYVQGSEDVHLEGSSPTRARYTAAKFEEAVQTINILDWPD